MNRLRSRVNANGCIFLENNNDDDHDIAFQWKLKLIIFIVVKGWLEDV